MTHSELFNNLDSYLETHFEITSFILKELENPDPTTPVNKVFIERGTGGMYEIARYLTDKFEDKHKNTVWDGNYFDELESFLQEECKSLSS